MTEDYNTLPKGPKRLIWAGYILYLVWMNLLGGWDAIIDPFFTSLWDNFAFTLIVMLSLYWLLVFLILWVITGFLD